jgi:hypothetical protein
MAPLAAQIGLDFSAKPAPGSRPVRGERVPDPVFLSIRAEVAREIASRRGEAQAVTGERLAEIVKERLGLEAMTLRTVQRRCEEAVEQIRDEGEQLIAATGAGKFTPETVEELERDLRQSTARALKQLRHRSRVKRALLEFRGQQRLSAAEIAR